MLHNKIFMTSLLSWLVGKKTGIKFCGTNEEIKLIKNAMITSKKFHNILNDKNSTFNDILNALEKKKYAIIEFEKATGLYWPI